MLNYCPDKNIDDLVQSLRQLQTELGLGEALSLSSGTYDSVSQWLRTLDKAGQHEELFDDFLEWVKSLSAITEMQLEAIKLIWGGLMLLDLKHEDIFEAAHQLQIESLEIDDHFGAELTISSFYGVKPKFEHITNKRDIRSPHALPFAGPPIEGMDEEAEERRQLVVWLDQLKVEASETKTSFFLQGMLKRSLKKERRDGRAFYVYADSKSLQKSFLVDKDIRKKMSEYVGLAFIIVGDNKDNKKSVFFNFSEGELFAQTLELFDVLNNHVVQEPQIPKPIQQRTIKIFLACSEELEADRTGFVEYCIHLSRFLEPLGIRLKVERWEEFSSAMSRTRSQDEYNKVISECELFVALFYSKVGKYTKDEFDVAKALFEDRKSPHIYTYFKSFDPKKIDKKNYRSLLNFEQELEDNYEHFYQKYLDPSQLYEFFSKEIEIYLINHQGLAEDIVSKAINKSLAGFKHEILQGKMTQRSNSQLPASTSAPEAEETKRIIKIFLASSNELKVDRDQFALHCYDYNEHLKRENVELKVVRWEKLPATKPLKRSQDEYNKHIPHCQFFVGLFHSKVGEYTEEEFDAAVTAQQNGKPINILAYFKSYHPDTRHSDYNRDDHFSLMKFEDKLRNQHEFFYQSYDEVDDLNEKFMQQIQIHLSEELNSEGS